METKSRLQALHLYMDELDLDSLFVTLPRSVFYFTNFNTNPHERFLCLFIQKGSEPLLIIPELDLVKAAKFSNVSKIITHNDEENPYDLIKKFINKNISRCGVEKGHMTLQTFEQIAEVTGAKEYINIDNKINSMKMIKSEEEVERIQNAIKMTEKSLAEGLKCLNRNNVRECDLAAEIEYQRKLLGAEGGGLMVVSGENTALPHGETSDKVIEEGDFLLIDMGVIKDGYVSDITRTFGIGEMDSNSKQIYETVLEANLLAIEAAKPGKTFGELDKVARKTIEEKGYGKYFTHRLGHGLGTNNHELPSIHGLNKESILPGMVFTIEPGIYVPGVGGVRIEDDILINENDAAVLSSFKKELTIL